MDQQPRKPSRKRQNGGNSSSSNNSQKNSRNLFALIGGESMQYMPYRSKFELNSIGSDKSRESRDSDLFNRLGKQPSKGSSKSLNKHPSNTNIQNRGMLSSNSNSQLSENSGKHMGEQKHLEIKEAPKIHNCVCFVAGECLKYNCNCFLSPFPCAPECCPNCLTLKATLPLKISNFCSCRKTKCLKLYCQCLSKGLYCSFMCQCYSCQNHQHSMIRKGIEGQFTMNRGCTCQKSHCTKKYCDCFAQGLKCTERCSCIDCKNFLELIPMDAEQKPTVTNPNSQEMDVEVPDMQFQPLEFFGKSKK